jgi:hypothetical protein
MFAGLVKTFIRDASMKPEKLWADEVAGAAVVGAG